MAAPAGLVGSGIAGRIATNLVAGGLETVLGRKLGGNEKMLCEAMGAFVAVGLQVGVFSGAGLGALLSPAARGSPCLLRCRNDCYKRCSCCG